MAATKMVTILFLAIMVAAPLLSNATITCQRAQSHLRTCIPYVKGEGNAPPPDCCEGLKTFGASATTRADRQESCRCAVEIAKAIPDRKDDRLAGLVEKCSLRMSYKFSVNTDCGKLK